MAKMSAFAVVALAIFSVCALFLLRKAQEQGGTEVRAAFKDAYPLLEGMNVRLYGAVAGRVGEIELGDDGDAHVTLVLFDGTEPPRADAVASIRQEDITGDSYVSLEPGKDEEELGNAEIPTSRTSVAPRFDDLLNSFNEPVRQGLELRPGPARNGARVPRAGSEHSDDPAPSRARGGQRRLRRGRVPERGAGLADRERRTGQPPGCRPFRSAREARRRSRRHTADDGRPCPGARRALEVAPPTLRAAEGTLGRLTRLAEASLPLANTLEAAARTSLDGCPSRPVRRGRGGDHPPTSIPRSG